MEPSFDWPWWLPLLVVASLAGLSTALSHGRWLRFLVASSVGTIAGLVSGVMMWPSEDVIGRGYVGFFIIPEIVISVLLSLVASLVMQKLSISNETYKRTFWIALTCCVAFGPIAVFLTPPLVARRVARTELVAKERFEALKIAAERVKIEEAGQQSVCDGQALRRNYSGPPFSDYDWRYVAGNYVKQDGYVFGIWCHQTDKDGYTIDAHPERQYEDGTRLFCTDESGAVGCGMERNRKRNACIPCPE
jgi:hypothetical protein